MKIDKIKLKNAMIMNGINNQADLALVLERSKYYISSIFKGKDIEKNEIIYISNKLKVIPSDLIPDSEKKNYDIDVNSSKNKKEITSIELFAGAGGLALGLEKAGITTKAFVEIDKICCETLKLNRPNWNIINDDISCVDFKKYKGKIDLVTGGFPCQAFSYAGKKLGFNDIRGTMFYEFARCIKEVEPLMFMGENVRGLKSHDNGRTLTTILDILSGLGYTVQYKVLNASNYGVAQKRERIFIIGIRNGCNLNFNYPKPYKKLTVLKDALKDCPLSEGQKYSENKRKVLDLVPPGGCWVDLPIDVQKKYMGKSFYSGGGKRGMARRISWDEPCLTLTCSPSQKQTERCHPDETRPFTVREYARIQSFPDSWEFSGKIGDKYKQIGNAVPVELARNIGNSILECLLEYKNREEF